MKELARRIKEKKIKSLRIENWFTLHSWIGFSMERKEKRIQG
jgi:hypothetical protein